MIIPRKLSTVPISPHYDLTTARKIDKVLVDGVHLPNCAAYDMDAGWAFALERGIWQPKVYGLVSVIPKEGQ